MYYFFVFLLLFVLCNMLFFHCRKRKIRKKICDMNTAEKCEKLTGIIEPLGYCYDVKQDVFSTALDAWQRNFGYTESYNYYAPHFNMVFDYEPIYFDYQDKTWLIELWKGQYGINTGAEVGIYYSDSYVPPALREHTLFHCVKDRDMLPMTLHLFQEDDSIAMLRKRHWWLTIFSMGVYNEPADLSANVSITFPTESMMNAFIEALNKKGYHKNDICVCGLTVIFIYRSCSTCKAPLFRRFLCKYAQWKNRIFCKLFLWVTKPFSSSLDRALCLYYYLPFAFRRLLTIKRYKTGRKRY
ncbi:MAG: DUF4474 domain-containing protein [Lachnospiraceae bacterium]|nr:DUF4474 domain-containing protein [Lachnospiraceae bacterium]